MTKTVALEELLKILGVSKSTIDRLLRKGLPHEKVGKKNLFDPDETERWVRRQGFDTDYVDVYYQAQLNHPDDPIKQVEFVRKHGTSQWYVFSLADIAQKEYSIHTNKKITFSTGEIDYLFRGIIDTLKHLSSKLPDGVFRYIANRIDTFTLNAIKQMNHDQYIEKRFVTYFEVTRETTASFNKKMFNPKSSDNSIFLDLLKGDINNAT